MVPMLVLTPKYPAKTPFYLYNLLFVYVQPKKYIWKAAFNGCVQDANGFLKKSKQLNNYEENWSITW